MTNKVKAVSFDALLLFVLVVATMDQTPDDLSFWKESFTWIQIILPSKPELMVFGDPLKALYNVSKVSFLIAYMLMDFIPLTNDRGRKAVQYGKLIIISSVVLISVIIPTANWVAARQIMGPGKYAHDGGVVQTEEAMKYLLKGEDPYSVTYENTPLRDTVNPALWQKFGMSENPTVHHYPYPPLNFIMPLPLLATSRATFGWYDQRMLYLTLFILMLITAYKIPADQEMKLSLVIALSLNPFAIPGIKEGMNDIILLFFVVLIIHLLRKGRNTAASLTLALACGNKQMAWILVPFFFMHLYETRGMFAKISVKDFLLSRDVMLFAATVLLIFLPFLIWDGPAFISDVLSYHSGTTEHPYPLRNDAGYGFANLVLHFGLVKSATSFFPFTLFQLMFTLPFLGYFLRVQLKKPSTNQMLAGYTMTLFVFLFFGRYMAANYIGFILSLLTILYFMPDSKAVSASV